MDSDDDITGYDGHAPNCVERPLTHPGQGGVLDLLLAGIDEMELEATMDYNMRPGTLCKKGSRCSTDRNQYWE